MGVTTRTRDVIVNVSVIVIVVQEVVFGGPGHAATIRVEPAVSAVHPPTEEEQDACVNE